MSTFSDVNAVVRAPVKIEVVIRPTIIQINEKILVKILLAVISPYLGNEAMWNSMRDSQKPQSI